MIADNTDLVVIGGGAAGMMCAATAADRGLKVILLDPNRQLGRKLRITGKGRCNLTNNCEIKTFMQNIPGDGRFLFSALNRLSPADTMALFESRGLELKTERGNRVFPVSDNANDVAGTMARWCARSGVTAGRQPSVPAACPTPSPAPPATGSGLPKRWATASRRPEPPLCPWKVRMPTVLRCRAFP